MIPGEFYGPKNLFGAQTLSVYKMTKIIIIGKDKDLVFIVLYVVTPSFEDFNNSQEFLIVSLVPSFGGDYFLKKKGY